MSRNIRRRLLLGLLSAILIYGLLLIPDENPALPARPDADPFAWNQDEVWESLEAAFLHARSLGCDSLDHVIQTQLDIGNRLLDSIASQAFGPESPEFSQLEQTVFSLAPSVAVCQQHFSAFARMCAKLRSVIKTQSIAWEVANDANARRVLYRLLYGSRAALEEVMLQAGEKQIDQLLTGDNESSQTPMASILGVNIHSGDILLSRGGAPTSALIARGNNYPGNFSHVALVHIDEGTHLPSIVEAHIESGVKIADLEAYLQDKKLRVLIVRPRSNLPEIQTDPLLPHKAAIHALEDALGRHIPYDFAMDWQNPEKQFCSEVASNAYSEQNIQLWMGISQISAPGLIRWLSLLGVEFFETHEPSDLEYDPQLTVVAEWRDIETLFQDHVDNAVIDVMLEGADAGDGLPFSKWLLPIGRCMKAYSMLLNEMGKVGPIPEGMTATTALRVQSFTDRHHAIRDRVYELVKEFEEIQGYRPPYWELVKLARQAVSEAP